MLENEDAERVRPPDGQIESIALDQIATMSPPISVMPPMLGILNKPQIRDVVAYLASMGAKKQ